MSGFFSGRDESLNRDGGKRLPPRIDEHLPLLSEALQGQWDAEKGCYCGPPYTLTVWQEGRIIGFVLGAGDLFPKFFGSFEGLDSGLESIEECLKLRKGKWVDPKPPKLR